ncbi:MAG TPA: CRTAC1 family protein [Candidatus Sulfotelmatobacter sp.]|nr:CRTAC1 family protein [Candidatus Sulfotelmatobacter sp.]
MISKINRRSFLLTALAAAPAGKLLGAMRAPATQPVIEFEDVTAKSGIRFQHQASRTSRKYLPESMGAGVAIFDYDNDGWLDLFFVNGAKLQDPMPRGSSPDKSDPRYWNRLYHNNRDGTFTDITEKAGLQGRLYGMGVATGDYDNDGNVDLLVTNLGGNILYHNNGDGTFTDVTAKAGVGGSGWCTGACFVDYDRDGSLDLMVSRYVQWDFSEVYCGEHRPGYRAYCHPDQFEPITHFMFHNNGDGTFTDLSKKCGIASSPGKGLGVAIDDFDGDGWPDIFVANDSVAEQLFRNNHEGTFTEVALISGLGYDQNGHAFAGMGADFGDYKNTGWPSVFVNALANQKYKLFRNDKGTFEDVTDSIGLGASTLSHSGWGAKWIDYDNDGWLDLFVAQGHVMDNIQLTEPSLRYLEPPLLLRNDQGRFSNVSPQSGSIFTTPIAARGAAFGDLDNDGRVDVAINCNDGPAIILHNRVGNGNHWLILNLTGTSSNRDAIGSKIRLVTESGQQQTRFLSTAGSYLAASDKRAHFGLGSSKKVRLIEITWPSGIVQRVESVSADQILQVKEPSR